jgi:hypothetical protein
MRRTDFAVGNPSGKLAPRPATRQLWAWSTILIDFPELRIPRF